MAKYKETLGMPNINFSIVEGCSRSRKIKYKKQRLQRGFDDTETWNLDSTILHFILPRLKRFRELANGYPPELGSFEAWQKKLDKAIADIELIYDDSPVEHMSKEESRAYFDKQGQAEKDIAEFLGEYLFHLWW